MRVLREKRVASESSKSWIGAGVAVWAIALNAILAGWMVPHTLPLRAIAMPIQSTPWTATHLLRTDCDCSAAVYRHLIARRARPDWQENVHLNLPRPEWIPPLERAGFRVEVTGVRSGPRLVLNGPSGQRWQGGYAPRRPRPGVALEDLASMQSFRAGRPPGPIAAYGCATNTP